MREFVFYRIRLCRVGIVDFDGEGVAAGRTEVNRRCDWFLDGTSGFSVYVGTGGDSHDE